MTLSIYDLKIQKLKNKLRFIKIKKLNQNRKFKDYMQTTLKKWSSKKLTIVNYKILKKKTRNYNNKFYNKKTTLSSLKRIETCIRKT